MQEATCKSFFSISLAKLFQLQDVRGFSVADELTDIFFLLPNSIVHWKSALEVLNHQNNPIISGNLSAAGAEDFGGRGTLGIKGRKVGTC